MEKYNPNIHHRKSIRLKGYDYSQAGLYFITICCENREHRLGKIAVGAENFSPKMILNDAGKIADECWMAIPKHFPNAVLHEHIVMPNHVHGIIELVNNTVGAENFPPNNDDVVNVGANNYSPKNDDANTVGANNYSPENDDANTVGANNYSPLPQIDAENKRAENFPPLQTPFKSPSKTIGSIVRGYKIGVTKWFRNNNGANNDSPLQQPPQPVWQRNYHEHIIRNEQSYQTISNYIINNPQNWKDDKFYS
jgi:putative transposase